MITTVLLDYDGTIHDWDTVLIRSHDGILGLSGEEFQKVWTFDIHRGIIHKRYKERHDDTMFHCQLLFEHLNRPFDRRIADSIIRKFKEAGEKAREDPIYFPDVEQALGAMKGMGLKLCLSTGTSAEIKAETLKRITGKNYFDHIFSEPAIGYLKTEPEYYEIALQMVGTTPREAVSIGDTPLSDIRPAKMIGITTIWVNRRGEPVPKSEDERADYEVEDLMQAVQILNDYV